MSTADNSGPAFPVLELNNVTGEVCAQHFGLSMRDYFAAHAPNMPPALREMAKLAEKEDGRDTSDFGAFARFEADWRFAYADAMLVARSKA